MINAIICGDALTELKKMPEQSVDCCVTSPPYYGLRDYGTAQWEGINPRYNHVAPLGREKTFEEYVDRLTGIFKEVRRVLKKEGTLWLVMGDSYASDTKWGGSTGGKHVKALHGKTGIGRNKKKTGLKPKDLIGIPWRVVFALQKDGWYLRSDIIWAKGNPMPESVTDRPTRSHEYIFLLAKSKMYYYDYEAIQEPLTSSSIKRLSQPNFDRQTGGEKDYGHGTNLNRSARRAMVNLKGRVMCPQVRDCPEEFARLAGRNKRDVWSVNTIPLEDAHYAAYPPELIRPCIRAGVPEFVCKKCGRPRQKIFQKNNYIIRSGGRGSKTADCIQASPTSFLRTKEVAGKDIIGLTDCGCGAGFDPGIVLDPFMGAGTTALVARQEGRNFIGIELNPAYVALAEKRLAATLPGPGRLKKVHGEKQVLLFETQ